MRIAEQNKGPNPYADKPYEVGRGKPPVHTRFGQPNGNVPDRTKIRWKESPQYQTRQIMKMTAKELKRFASRDDLTVAQRLALKNVMRALNSENERVALKATEAIIDRMDGKAIQKIEAEVETKNNPFEGLTVEELKKLAE